MKPVQPALTSRFHSMGQPLRTLPHGPALEQQLLAGWLPRIDGGGRRVIWGDHQMRPFRLGIVIHEEHVRSLGATSGRRYLGPRLQRVAPSLGAFHDEPEASLSSAQNHGLVPSSTVASATLCMAGICASGRSRCSSRPTTKNAGHGESSCCCFSQSAVQRKRSAHFILRGSRTELMIALILVGVLDLGFLARTSSTSASSSIQEAMKSN